MVNHFPDFSSIRWIQTTSLGSPSPRTHHFLLMTLMEFTNVLQKSRDLITDFIQYTVNKHYSLK